MMAISMLGKTYTPKQERHLNNEVKTDLMYINLHLFTELLTADINLKKNKNVENTLKISMFCLMGS